MLAPLNDAACLYRAQAYSPTNTLIPNEGTRSEPLNLGSTLGADATDPLFVADAIGDYLRFPPGQMCCAAAPVPVSVLNGDVTFAIRHRPEGAWTQRKVLIVTDNHNLPGELKHFYLTIDSANKYLARFWEDTPTHSQIWALSTTSASVDRTDTVAVTWDSATKTSRLFVNGVQEATFTSANPRSDAASSPLYAPTPGTVQYLQAAGKLFALGVWDRALSAGEISALGTNSDWLAGGGGTPPPPPPPPPSPGVLIVKLNGVVQPGASVTIDGAPVVPSGTADKVVEVTA